jgi:hypothetical protein
MQKKIMRLKNESEVFKKIKVLFKRIKHKTIDTKTVKMNIPIFKLHSPKVIGSKVVNRVKSIATTGDDWTFSVFGLGTGATQTLKISNTTEFDSENGDCVILFIPIVIRVSVIETIKRKKSIGKGIKAELVNHKKQYNYQKGVTDCDESVCLKDIDKSKPYFEIFPLKKARYGKIIKYEKEINYSERYGINFSFSCFGSKIKMKSVLSSQKDIKLEYILPGGHDYYLAYTKKVPGICWHVKST